MNSHPAWCEPLVCAATGDPGSFQHRELAAPWSTNDGVEVTVGRVAFDDGLACVRLLLHDEESHTRDGGPLEAETHLTVDDAQRLVDELRRSIAQVAAERRGGPR
ncbi:MAG: hypothetical protein L0I76_05760 [Pseudonocardia sp.]|nr:hypothetical protein [Pseudonocardia sp.]